MSEILHIGRRVLSIEAQGLNRVRKRLGPDFEEGVGLILDSPGKVITTGIGKSGIVARKIMATLNSTGTNAIFLHPVEAMHGDLGSVARRDVALALSNSGETDELVNLVPVLKERGARVIALTGGLQSGLAQEADVVIDCGVEQEACPMNLTPTASTTACMAMGDALAVALMEKRRFNAEDFKRHHPGGALGERLALMVKEVMLGGKKVPMVSPRASLRHALKVMNRGDLGHVIIAAKRVVKGIFTDGDLRRVILEGIPGSAPVSQVMTPNPLCVAPGALAVDALHFMEEKLITALPVVDQNGKVLGIVHLHDLLGRGKVSFKALAQPRRNGKRC